MSYTQDQLDSLHLAKRRLYASGKPEVVAKIDYMINAEASYEEIWAVARADVEAMVKPEKPTEVVPPPPLTGRGSGTKEWQQFALAVSEIEPEVVMAMGRNDLIRVLADRGIIEMPEFLLGE